MNKVGLIPLRVGLLVIISSLLSAFPVLSAQQSTSLEIPLVVFNENRPVQLQDLVSSASLDLYIPKGFAVVDGSWLKLVVEASPLLDMERSSLTVVLNDLQVTSIKLGQLTTGSLQIELPRTMIKVGANTLTFIGTLYLPYDKESDCTNWNDPSRWLNLSSGSTVHLGIEAAPANFNLADFPIAFANPLESYQVTTGAPPPLVVLPDAPTSDDLSNLTAIAYAMGSQSISSQAWQPEIISESEFDSSQAANRHSIFINIFPSGLNIMFPAKKDFVALKNSPWDAGKIALVIGDRDRLDGFSPAVVFSDPQQRVILNGNLAYLEPPVTLPEVPAFMNTYTFEVLGYLDRSVRGIGDSSLTYRFFIPYDVSPTNALMNLVITHSPDLDTGTSTITVYVNGFSVAGIVPNSRSANLTPVKVSIPTTRFRPGVNFIRITFNLQATFTSCERTPDAVWATVLNQTALNTDFYIQERTPSLDFFPMPFSDNPAGIFVLPDQPEPQTLSRVAELAFRFGQAAMVTDRPPSALKDSDFDLKVSTSPYIILIGKPAHNSHIMAVNDFLPQPFTPDGLGLAKDYGIFAPTAQEPAELGLLQILSSPEKGGGVFLVVTGLGEQGLEWTWDVLLDTSQWSQFTGNLMLVGSEQRLAAASKLETKSPVYRTTENVSRIPLIGNFLQGIKRANLIPAAVSMIAALVLMLLLLFIVQSYRRI